MDAHGVTAAGTPWVKPLGYRRGGGFYTCGWCHLDIKGDGVSVLSTESDSLKPGRPMYEARHKNGDCETHRMLFDTDAEGNAVWRCFVGDYAFAWRPKSDTITATRQNSDAGTIPAHHLTAQSTRAFVSLCESWVNQTEQ